MFLEASFSALDKASSSAEAAGSAVDVGADVSSSLEDEAPQPARQTDESVTHVDMIMIRDFRKFFFSMNSGSPFVVMITMKTS